MSTLKEILASPGTRPQVIRDSEQIIEEEVASKGLAGIAIKGAFAVVKAIKPGFIHEVIDGLLDDFADRLDPLYQSAKTKNEPITVHFNARAAEAAEALLGITDQRAQRAKNQIVKTAYEKLRPMAKKHTEAAIPRVAKMIAKHDATASAAPATP
jgi:vacuolar-type H+-ATPase subunit H